jgi:hypothetical protein
MARSARLERVPDNGYAVCSAPGVEANWYAVNESTPWGVGRRKEDPWLRGHRGVLCADLVISEQGSVLAYAVTEWGETGKSNDLCSS